MRELDSPREGSVPSAHRKPTLITEKVDASANASEIHFVPFTSQCLHLFLRHQQAGDGKGQVIQRGVPSNLIHKDPSGYSISEKQRRTSTLTSHLLMSHRGGQLRHSNNIEHRGFKRLGKVPNQLVMSRMEWFQDVGKEYDNGSLP